VARCAIVEDVPIYLSPDYDGLVDLDAGEEAFEGRRVLPPVLVVVPPHLEVAGLRRIGVVEAAEQVVDRGVGNVDLLEVVVLPELLRVAQLDVGEPLFEVVFQGALVDERIACKFVARGAVAPVAVRQDDEPGVGGQVLNFSVLQGGSSDFY
jgi:hypothetical protein